MERPALARDGFGLGRARQPEAFPIPLAGKPLARGQEQPGAQGFVHTCAGWLLAQASPFCRKQVYTYFLRPRVSSMFLELVQ